jgi:hypothetical protein
MQQQCPICGASVSPFLVLGADVTTRRSFALAVAFALLPLDLLIAGVACGLMHNSVVRGLVLVAGAWTLRFAVAFWVMWSRAVHVSHGGAGSSREALLLAIIAPLLCSVSFWLWAAMLFLLPR